jgi:hypothetical protein
VIASISFVDFGHCARDLPTAQGLAARRPLLKVKVVVGPAKSLPTWHSFHINAGARPLSG